MCSGAAERQQWWTGCHHPDLKTWDATDHILLCYSHTSNFWAEDDKSKFCSCGTKVSELALQCADPGELQVCALSWAGGVGRAELPWVLAGGWQPQADHLELPRLLGGASPKWNKWGHSLLAALPSNPALDCIQQPRGCEANWSAALGAGWFLRCVERGAWLLQPTHAVKEQSVSLKPSVHLSETLVL